MEYSVGQALIAVLENPGSSPSIRPAQIDTVGRKWVHCSDGWKRYRIDPSEHVILDRDDEQIGCVFPNLAAYEEHCRCELFLTRLRRSLMGCDRVPVTCSSADIIESARLLGIDVTTEQCTS